MKLQEKEFTLKDDGTLTLHLSRVPIYCYVCGHKIHKLNEGYLVTVYPDNIFQCLNKHCNNYKKVYGAEFPTVRIFPYDMSLLNEEKKCVNQ